MEWLSDPTIWVGFITLVVLEIVLGVDNLIFIAILAGKLPPAQRNRARIVGLSLAMVMRLGLLASITWVMSLTAPILSLWKVEISWRDSILIAGGLFLLVKATTEIHERLEAQRPENAGAEQAHAAFWPLVAQIVVLDAVFSLDSIITAVGLVDELYVMMAAVIVSVALMLVASKPLTAFILVRPSLIILCLGFLLMVGLVLVVDGFGIHLPKGYLYAAIGFSILIELLNQWGERNRRKSAAAAPVWARARVAEAVLRMLGGVPAMATAGPEEVAPPAEASKEVFGPEEKSMVKEVLGLAERPVTAAMTAKVHVEWLDLTAPKAAILAKLKSSTHREFPVGHGSLAALEGVARKEDLLELALESRPFELKAVLRKGISVRENCSLLDTLRVFKKHPIELALVLDARGALRGVVTRTDLLEAIAGDLPDLE
jgi:predicted tellurium resistance membrane protein TerC